MSHKLFGEEILKKWRKNRPEKPFPIVALLDNIRSVYNVGSMFRTSACAYISELILCGITAHPPHPKLEKTALKTIDKVKWSYEKDIVNAVKNLKQKGYTICLLEITKDSEPIQNIKKTDFPLALVVGNEVDGVTSDLFFWADKVVEIPLYGEKESLNVAVAFGIALFFLIEKFKE